MIILSIRPHKGGGGTGYFAMFYPVLHCRNTLEVRYSLYYSCNIAQSALCRLWGSRMSVTDKHKAHRQTTRHAPNTAKIRVPLCLCFALFVCISLCLFVCLFLCLSVFPFVPVPFCLNVRVNGKLNSCTER